MTGLAPAGSRLVGDWQSRPDLVALVNDFAGAWPPPVAANIICSLCRRLDIPAQFLVGSEILAAPDVARATPAKVEWRAPPPAVVDGFASAVPQGVVVFLLYHVARRLNPALQLALGAEIIRPLGPALAMWSGRRQ